MRSMTAFGRKKETLSDGRCVTVEIRSVNNRYFDCSVRLPRAYAYLEEKIKPYLTTKGVTRGKVDFSLSVDDGGRGQTGTLTLDRAYAEQYVTALRTLRDEFDLFDDISVMSVARFPELFVTRVPEEDPDAVWAAFSGVIDGALEQFFAARENEGRRLAEDIRAKLVGIGRHVDAIEALSAADTAGYRTKLEERLRAVLSEHGVAADEGRILTECAIFADKIAVDEELVRLRSHFATFEEIAGSDEPAGRRLDFLLQEINREINTVGSKCQNAEIARHVVDVKTELEKIREQVQNLE